MKIAICDDNSEQIAIIKAAAEKYFCARKSATVEIDTFQNALDFLDSQEKSGYDLALLDICMPGMLGIDVAKEIRQRRDKTEIVFLTTSDEYAVEAFRVSAAHYLLKPLTQRDFDEAMDRVLQNIGNKHNKTVYLRCPVSVVEAVDKDAIIYIEGAAHKQSVVLADGRVVETVQTMAELLQTLESLSEGQFISPYKGFIVNQTAISMIESGRIVLKSGKCIPIPRGSFRQIKQTYFNYMFKGRN